MQNVFSRIAVLRCNVLKFLLVIVESYEVAVIIPQCSDKIFLKPFIVSYGSSSLVVELIKQVPGFMTIVGTYVDTSTYVGD